MKQILGGIKKHELGGAVSEQPEPRSEAVVLNETIADAAITELWLGPKWFGANAAGVVGSIFFSEAQQWLELHGADLRRKAEAEEEQRKMEVEKSLPKKVPLKNFIYKFLERDSKLNDDKAFVAMQKLEAAKGMGDAELALLLFSVHDYSISHQVIKWFTTTDVIGDSEVFDFVEPLVKLEGQSKTEAEEEQRKMEVEKSLPKKVPLKDFIYKFLERDPKLDDDKAFAAMQKLETAQGIGDAELARLLVSVQDHSINNQVIKWFTTTDIIGDSEVFDF